MKKILLIFGILLIILGVIGLLIGGLIGYASVNTLDGSPDLYARQRKLMLIFLLAGVAAIIVGIICFVMRKRIGL